MELWTGLACLVPNPNCKDFNLFAGKGAYVNVVTWAESAVHFEERVRTIVAEQLGCILREMENIGLLEPRMQRDDFPDEFINMRQTAIRQPSDVVFGTFYTWSQGDTN